MFCIDFTPVLKNYLLHSLSNTLKITQLSNLFFYLMKASQIEKKKKVWAKNNVKTPVTVSYQE